MGEAQVTEGIRERIHGMPEGAVDETPGAPVACVLKNPDGTFEFVGYVGGADG